MKAVIQRVSAASVSVDNEVISKINSGLLVLLGVAVDDEDFDADILSQKISKLRIFSDENGKMNKSVIDTDGSILVISNFTLYANTQKGNRPDFINAAPPDKALRLYELFIDKLKANGVKEVYGGKFGGDMKVSLCNDGPVTIIMDTIIWRR